MMNNEVGVLVSLRRDEPLFEQLRDLQLSVCQLVSWAPALWTDDELAARVKQEAADARVRITALWAGWGGPSAWNFVEGPITLGLVPASYRAERVATLKLAGDFAHNLGVPAIITHLGFLPENPLDPVFSDVVVAVREVAGYLKARGMQFWFETGQETPITMLRLIKAVGTANLGINLDPANLIMYGKANPTDALDTFGGYVRNIHGKDGQYPTDPASLGPEVKVGQGRVRYPDFVRRLKEIGFSGEFIIEREISGEEQRRDIADTSAYLKQLLRET